MSTPDELLDALDRGQGDAVKLTAVLWTWLDRHLLDLASLQAKPYAIRAAMLDAEPFSGWSAEEREQVRRSPLRGAAELLTRIHNHLWGAKAPPFGEPAAGVDGTTVLVSWSRPLLAALVGGGAGPPGADEEPSVAALAPWLTVTPQVQRDIELRVVRLEGEGWRAAQSELERGFLDRNLSVHLEPLEDHGLTGWKEQQDPHVGWYDDETIDADDERRCRDAAISAIEAAAGSPAILIMPELAVTQKVLDEIRAELSTQPYVPALTVVGLYHRPATPDVDPELVADEPLAGHINEAVVLGPDGSELWRHRKLSSARAPGEVDTDELPVAEDVAPGRRLDLVQSPIGTITLMICLDAFIEHARERVARSGATVLLVPSLSPRVHRHRDSLQQLVQALWAIAFVCNRAPRAPENGGTVWNEQSNRSFWAIQRRGLGDPTPCADRPAFVFRLDKAV